MINNDFEIAALIAKYISEKITSEESHQLKRWREEKKTNELLFQKLCDSENQKQHYSNIDKFDLKQGWSQVNRRINRRMTYIKTIKITTYAAAILLPLIFIGSYLFPPLPDITNSHLIMAHDISVGVPKAKLTLDNGEVINITNMIDEYGCEEFIQRDSSTIHFQNKQLATVNKELKYNTIEIPRGGEYKLILSDGTRVHLNSLSSLRFPATFLGNSRNVELIGEAYFEVNRNNKSFIVSVNGMHVEVLGTNFNVSAYPNEDLLTTLVSGSVKLHTDKGKEYLLKPSQQAALCLENQEINIQEVNIETYTSWVNVLIHFTDERLEDIMKTLSRWYDMDVIYNDDMIKNLRFGCFVDKYEEITPLINLIKNTEKVKAKIDGKTILFYN